MNKEESTSGFRPKKSVALSGVPAGTTALCTVGRSGNDLHYRGYDILDIADTCEFEEIAYRVDVHLAEHLEVLQVLIRDAGDGQLGDFDLVLAHQVQEQVQRTAVQV